MKSCVYATEPKRHLRDSWPTERSA